MPQITVKNPPADALLWVDQIPTLEISTDLPKVSMTVYRGNRPIHSLDLYPFEGRLSVFVSDIIAEDMAISGVAYQPTEISFTAEGAPAASVRLQVVYRRMGGDMSAEEFCARNFLTLSQVRRLPLSASDSVTFLLQAGEHFDQTLEVIYRRPDGSFGRTPKTAPGITADTCQLIDAEIEWPEVPEGCEPVTLSYSAGRRRCTWYRTDAADMIFSFDNAFGVPEQLHVRGSASWKLTSKYSLARIRGRLMPYDQDLTEEITVRLSPMLPADVVRLSQISMARHPQWRQLPAGEFSDIVISSATFEADEDPDELPAPEITFRRTDPMPATLYPADGRIFTQPFTEFFT